MTLRFYRITTKRNDVAATAPGGEPLSRESYACAERADYTLFLWRSENGEPRMLQFLFGERFIEWSAQEGAAAERNTDNRWRAGSTNRSLGDMGAAGRGKGVRTLHVHRATRDGAGDGDSTLQDGLAILRAAGLPAGLADLVAASGQQ